MGRYGKHSQYNSCSNLSKNSSKAAVHYFPSVSSQYDNRRFLLSTPTLGSTAAKSQSGKKRRKNCRQKETFRATCDPPDKAQRRNCYCDDFTYRVTGDDVLAGVSVLLSIILASLPNFETFFFQIGTGRSNFFASNLLGNRYLFHLFP